MKKSNVPPMFPLLMKKVCKYLIYRLNMNLTVLPPGIEPGTCLLYTSDAADERSSVDLGGSRIIKTKKEKKKNNTQITCQASRCRERTLI